MKLLTSLRKECATALGAALVAPFAASPVDLPAPGMPLLEPNAAATSPAAPAGTKAIPDRGVWQVLWSRGVSLTPTWSATVDVDDGLQLCLRLKLR